MKHFLRRIAFLLLAILFLPLAACGKKPNQLRAPSGAETSDYPRAYPAEPKPASPEDPS